MSTQHALSEELQSSKDQIQNMSGPEAFATAQTLINEDRVFEAAFYYARAIADDTQNLTYIKGFMKECGKLVWETYHPEIEDALLMCLQADDKTFDYEWMIFAWFSVLASHPDLQDVFDVSSAINTVSFKPEGLETLQDYSVFLRPFVFKGLQTLIVYNLIFEEFLVNLRSQLLQRIHEKTLPHSDDEIVELVESVADYWFRTDYLRPPLDADHKPFADIKKRLEAGGSDATQRLDVAMYACYAPLHQLPVAQTIVDHLPNNLLVQKHIKAFLELKSAAERIEPLTPIGDDVSQAVQAQYEEFPYPIWESVFHKPLAGPEKELLERDSTVNILIAGCGTGREALFYAINMPHAHVLAVDLSRTSLAWGKNKAAALGVKNVEFKQADILKLGDIGKTFDFIASSGVLHHMEDPMAGWEVLTGLLKPGAAMTIGLYSELARQPIVHAREIIAREGFGNDRESMQSFRKQAPQLLEKQDFLELMSSVDYYSLPMFRDLLFHVQEHRFTIPMIQKAMETLHLEFVGFNMDNLLRAGYDRLFPEDENLENLENWNAYEKVNPTTFQGMYQFFCRKPESVKAEKSKADAKGGKADQLCTQADLLMQAGKLKEAERVLQKSLKKEKTVRAYRTLAVVYAMQGDNQKVVDNLEEALEIDVEDAASLAMMAEILLEEGDMQQALGHYVLAIKADPEELHYKEKFMALVSALNFTEFNPHIADILTLCFDDDVLDYISVVPVWLSLFRQHPEFAPYFSKGNDSLPIDETCVRNLLQQGSLHSPFFLRALKRLLIRDMRFEELVKQIRSFLLMEMHAENKTLREDERLALATAVAHYVYFTNYIIEVSEEEQKILGTLPANLEENPNDAMTAMIYACYHPMHQLQNAKGLLLGLQDNLVIEDVVKEQLADWLAVLEKEEKIESITRIDDDVSLKIQEQYETFPFPQWRTFSRIQKDEKTDKLYNRDGVKVLIAGCGTGMEAAKYGEVMPKSDILAVDISRRSLAYAKHKVESLGYHNVTFRHGDILQLGVLKDKYDYIASCGVLHHMKDPMAGWRTLTDLLKPGGVMHIGLYSEVGRSYIVRARDVIAEKGYKDTTEDMLAFRRAAQDILEPDDYAELSQRYDFFTLNGMKDLLFNVQEHRFDIPQIKACLEELGLEFAGFTYASPTIKKQYDEEYPNDPQGLSLDNWHAFEEKYPFTYASMYQFFCRKKK